MSKQILRLSAQNDEKEIRHTERIFGRVESSKASELVSRRFSTERLRQSLKVKSRKSTARKSKTALRSIFFSIF